MSLHIYAKDFRSYPELDWTLPSGLTLVDGVNCQTNGSNASGKSTLFDAWFVCRYGWLPKWEGPKGGSPDALIRRKEGQTLKQYVIKATERFGKDEIFIQRERPNKLTVWKNGEELKGIDQAGLDELLGMNAQRFLVSVYLHQRRKKSFYWMTDNDRTELLSVISNLEQLDKCYVVAKAQKEEAQLGIKKIEGALEVYQNRIPRVREQIAHYKKNKFEAQLELGTAKETLFKESLNQSTYSTIFKKEYDSTIEGAKIQLNDHLTETRQERAMLIGKMNGLNQSLSQFPMPEKELFDAVEEAQHRLSNDRKHESIRMNILRENDSLQHSMRHLEQLSNNSLLGVCAECSQILPEEQRHTDQKKYEDQKAALIKQFQVELPVVDFAVSQRAFDEALLALTKRKAELELQPEQTKKEIQLLKSKIDQKLMYEKSLEAKCEAFVKDHTLLLNAKLGKLAEAVKFAQENVKRLDYKYDCLKRDYDSSVYELQNLELEIQTSEKDLQKWKYQLDEALDLIDIFGAKGFRAICFDGLVERISEKASELLGIMTNNLYSTRLEQLKYDTKGNQKLVLRPILFKKGIEVPQDDLSGGMESRVSLVYDIALSMAVGEELPLLLDEALEGLDAVGKEEAMILLEAISKTRSVLVIDHSSEFKAIFNQVIRVIYENEESRLEILD